MTPTELKTTELQLGDIVELYPGPFGTGTVKQIKKGAVTIFRPYVTTADFAVGGGRGELTYTSGRVACLIGIEEVTYRPNSKRVFNLLARTPRYPVIKEGTNA